MHSYCSVVPTVFFFSLNFSCHPDSEPQKIYAAFFFLLKLKVEKNLTLAILFISNNECSDQLFIKMGKAHNFINFVPYHCLLNVFNCEFNLFEKALPLWYT